VPACALNHASFMRDCTKAFAGLVFIGPFCNEIVRAFSLDCDTRHAKEKEEEEKENIQHPRGLSYYILL